MRTPPAHPLDATIRHNGELARVVSYAWSASEEQWVYTLRLPSSRLLRVGERQL
jgi:hypothetical protein